MPSAIVRQIVGDTLTRGSKSKGKKFVAELGSALSPASIAKGRPATQPCKTGYKK